MENEADWLYIVLAALTLVISMFSSKKKKTLQKRTQIEKPTPLQIPSEQKQVAAKRPLTFLELREMRGDLPDEPKEHLAVTNTPQLTAEGSEYSIQNVEELKKAVIYAEILNRKY